MASSYMKEYNKFDPNARPKEFNLDKEKIKLKQPYKVPRDFTSTNKAVYLPFKVKPQQRVRPEDSNKELGNPCFIGSTTYNKTY